MKIISLDFTFTHVPGVMKRGRHVLVLLKDEAGNYILGSKHIYPENIYRMVGGGMDETDPVAAAVREVREELGVPLKAQDLRLLAQIEALIHESGSGKTYRFTTYLFTASLPAGQSLSPADDLDEVVRVSRPEMAELVRRYFALPTDLVRINHRKPGPPFRWSDYGRFYGQVHQIALDLTADSQN